MKTELTICMPVYNGENYLDVSIGSILNQTFHDFVLLVYDDGSTDSSVEKIKSFNDSRINLIEGKNNHGGIWARTELIKSIDTKYCMWIDDDDRFCRNDAFEYALNCIKSNDYDIVNFVRYNAIDKEGNVITRCEGIYDNFSYCGGKLFEKFFPVDYQYLFYSKIFSSSILKASIPDERILNCRFYTDDIFFSPLWYYVCKKYLHISDNVPFYEWKNDVGIWGSNSNRDDFNRIGDLCKGGYQCFVSIFNRFNAIRKMTNGEMKNFIHVGNIFYIVNKIVETRRIRGDEYADKLVDIFHSAFCKDGIHLLNGIDAFSYPEYVQFFNSRIMKK